jgi:radical SAM superfamily enzyme YgiQ (UPF0313 family)
VFTVAAHLRSLNAGNRVDALDAGALNMTWKELGDRLYQGRYELVALANDFDAVDDLDRTIRYVRELSPTALVVTFGRLSNQVAELFCRLDLDGVVQTGDYEAGIEAFTQEGGGAAATPGVWVRSPDGWLAPSGPGPYIPACHWALPDVTEIPYVAYDRMYRSDANKFCGIPERRELVVPVARGCPIGCDYCEVPGLQGRRERRLSVGRTLDYIHECFARLRFDYVAFYAPTFTLNRPWVGSLCEQLVALGSPYPWKCSTTLAHLDEDLVGLMAASGCVRISIGLETLDQGGFAALPRVKRIEVERFDQLAGWCRRLGVELNVFVILGFPGTTVEGARATAEHVRGQGARLRPTMYMPHHPVTLDTDLADAARYNRHTVFGDWSPDEATGLRDLLFGHETAPARVMRAVPRRAEIGY